MLRTSWVILFRWWFRPLLASGEVLSTRPPYPRDYLQSLDLPMWWKPRRELHNESIHKNTWTLLLNQKTNYKNHKRKHWISWLKQKTIYTIRLIKKRQTKIIDSLSWIRKPILKQIPENMDIDATSENQYNQTQKHVHTEMNYLHESKKVMFRKERSSCM